MCLEWNTNAMTAPPRAAHGQLRRPETIDHCSVYNTNTRLDVTFGRDAIDFCDGGAGDPIRAH